MQDTKTPLRVSIFAIGLNIVLAIWFSLSLDMGAYGLAWAQSIGAIVEISLLLFLMKKRIKGLFDHSFVLSIVKMIIASAVAGIFAYILVSAFYFLLFYFFIIALTVEFVMLDKCFFCVFYM
jgi:putative peptidoglycan lipid II flippase